MEQNIYEYCYHPLKSERFLYYRYFHQAIMTFKQIRTSLEIMAYLTAYRLKTLDTKVKRMIIYAKRLDQEIVKITCDLQKASSSAKYLLYHAYRSLCCSNLINQPIIMLALQCDFIEKELKQLSFL